jgi:hypothetical protein
MILLSTLLFIKSFLCVNFIYKKLIIIIQIKKTKTLARKSSIENIKKLAKAKKLSKFPI